MAMNSLIEPYGIVAAVLAISFILFTFRQYHRGKIGIRALLLWEALWGILFITGIFPGIYKSLAAYLGMATPLHFITTFSIIVLFLFTFLIYQKVSDLDKKILGIAQYLAISDSESKDQRKKDNR